MNQHTLEILARARIDVMERILRTARHRGFRVQSMNMDESDDAQQLTIQLTVSSDRSISLLFNQLTKLIDVAQVNEVSGKQQQWA